MKYLNLTLILLAIATSSAAQYNFGAFKHVPLAEKEDYRAAESRVKSAVRYLMEHPQNPQDVDFLHATQFIIRWMEGTPDYNYSIEHIGPKIMKKKNELLFGVYLACLIDFSFKYPEKHEADEHASNLYAAKFLAEYCDKPENNVNKSKYIKGLIDAHKNGSLEDYIGL